MLFGLVVVVLYLILAPDELNNCIVMFARFVSVAVTFIVRLLFVVIAAVASVGETNCTSEVTVSIVMFLDAVELMLFPASAAVALNV